MNITNLSMNNIFLPASILLFAILLSGCPNQPKKDAQVEKSNSSKNDEPTEVPMTSDENGEMPEEVVQDDPESVAALEKAGVVFKKNEAGLIVQANCKPAQMTKELMALLKGIPHVESLDLENGQFENEALAVLEHLPKLKTLNLRQCSNVDADGLAHLKKAPQLERLLLLYTRTNDEGLTHIAELKNLVVLDLRGTKIGDEGVNKLVGLDKLVDLKIRSTNVTGESMATIGKMTKLRYLALEDAGVGDDHISELTPLKNLISFNIMRTYVSDEGLSTFSDQKFQDLRVRDTAVGGAGLDGLKGSVGSLKFLDLSETLIDNDGVSHVAPFTNLESLLLWNGTMDDDGLQPLTSLTKLSTLDIHGCRSLTSGCVEHLLKMENLKDLNIAETGLDDEGLLQLAELKSLKSISLGQTSVTDEGIEKFQMQRPDCKVDQ